MAAITERTDKNGRTKYTVRIRIRGQEPQTATFGRRTDAVQWVQLMESDIRMGKRISTCEARKGSLGKELNKILSPLNGSSASTLDDVKVQVSSYFSLGLTADQISKLKVTVEHNGNSRKVDAADIAACATHYDITGQVKKNKDTGFPLHDDVHGVCCEIIDGDIRSLVRT